MKKRCHYTIYVAVLFLLLMQACTESKTPENINEPKLKVRKDSIEPIETTSSKEPPLKGTSPVKLSKFEENKTHIEQRKTTENNLEVTYDFLLNSVKKNSSISASLIKTLKIKEKTKPWHDNFEYYILDTLELKPGISTYLIIQYYDSESMGYLFNYSDTKFIDMLKVFYNNAEGCWSDQAVIFDSNLIYIENYDCSKEEQKQEQENALYMVGDDGKFEEITIETT